jgi:hypothetical protein
VAPAQANKRYLEILQMAAEEGETRVDAALRHVLEAGEMGEGKLCVAAVRAVLNEEASVPPATHIAVDEVALASFDELLDGAAGMGARQ